MNPIGVSCPGFTKIPFPEMLEAISKSFHHWEVFSELNHYAPDVSKRYHALMDESGLTFSIHTGIADINVASTNEFIRVASLNNLLSEMEAANHLGIDTVTIHPGIINLAVKDTRDISICQARKSMKTLEKASEEYGVYACIENMPNFPIMLGTTAEELESIVDGTDLPICFDIGHANTMGQIEDMISTFKDRIKNIHIHDNLGKNDDHMTIGEGNIDFSKVIKLLSGYSRRFIIESKSLESAEISQDRLKILLSH